MRGSVSVCLYKGRQIEKTCINFFEESGLSAILIRLIGILLFKKADQIYKRLFSNNQLEHFWFILVLNYFSLKKGKIG